MSFALTQKRDPGAAKRAALEKLRASATPKAEDAVIMKYIAPAECVERVRIVFDDSGSMSAQIQNAKSGVVEFLRNCRPNNTAVAVHYLETKLPKQSALQSDLCALALMVDNDTLVLGGTPLFTTLKSTLEADPVATRLVVFTDGSPTDSLVPYDSSCSDMNFRDADVIIALSHARASEASLGVKCIPIDTVFFGEASLWNKRPIALLKYLSDKTGGICLHFDPSKPNFSFKHAFKYLAPTLRLQLTDGAFRKSVENGSAR